MLGRVPHPTPPENSAQRQDVVQPGLADLGRIDLGWIVIILECTQKREGTGEIVISHNEGMVPQRNVVALMDIVANFTQLGQNLLVAPPLKGTTQVDTNRLAKHTSVDALKIVVWQHHRRINFLSQGCFSIGPSCLTGCSCCTRWGVRILWRAKLSTPPTFEPCLTVYPHFGRT